MAISRKMTTLKKWGFYRVRPSSEHPQLAVVLYLTTKLNWSHLWGTVSLSAVRIHIIARNLFFLYQ